MKDEYDVIVIGAGPVGENAAGRSAEGGVDTLLVERELAGGECSYRACMPSKTLLRPGEVPPIPGLREAKPWDSRAVTAAKEVPRRLLVLGGGVVGVEMAQAWWRLGAEEVTIIERGERLLSMEEPFVGDELRAPAPGHLGQGTAP